MASDRNALMPLTLAVIPARSGSKGVRGKNLRILAGQPLLAWTISAARESETPMRVIVSTDDDEITQLAMACGAEVPFRRPSTLATDTASTLDVVLHAIEWFVCDQGGPPEVVVLLQPTSPFRTAADIDSAMELFTNSGADSVIGVGPAEHPPEWTRRLDAQGRLMPIVSSAADRRQDLPPAYRINGSVYVIRTSVLRSTRTFEPPGAVALLMPRERSIDIDTEFDFVCAEAVANTLLAGKSRPPSMTHVK